MQISRTGEMPIELVTPAVNQTNCSCDFKQRDAHDEDVNETPIKPQRYFYLPIQKMVPDLTVVSQSCFGLILINGHNDHQRNFSLGVILLDKQDVKVEELRRLICSQIPSTPVSFVFLTKDGYPIRKEQERMITASHLISDKNTISIKRHFEKNQVGIILVPSGECLGFIFADLNWNVKKVRETVDGQLHDLNKHIKLEYVFLEHHGWPLTYNQELMLTLVDILKDMHISIKYRPTQNTVPSLPEPIPHSPLQITESQNDQVTEIDTPDGTTPSQGAPKKRSSMFTRISWRRTRVVGNPLVAKPILISYVRAEAAAHAVNLKQELCNLGFSVYLDVHEIKTGCDWQDALNYAISHCSVFVPLITPMYGKTQWTNREVKLADVLDKLIIPVSFLDKWPPECLAIQFASTQYIPWKSPDSDHIKNECEMKVTDFRVWESGQMQRVAKEIADFCKSVFSRKEKLSKLSRSFRKGSLLQMAMHNSISSPTEGFPSKILYDMGKEQEDMDSSKFVVISAHPSQRLLAHQLKMHLAKQHLKVWCSTEMFDSSDYIVVDSGKPISASNTPQDLPTIPEGESVLSQHYMELSRCIDRSKYPAPITRTDSEAGEKKPLVRMISQISDTSQGSVLTPEKMERLKMFQQQVNQAGVVIVIVSKEYTSSKTSQQQVFYIEHRKQVILIKYDHSPIPSWFRMLIGNDMITQNMNNPQFLSTLSTRIKRALCPDTSMAPKEGVAEAKIQFWASLLMKMIPDPNNCVYVAGSSKLNHRTEEICRAIGQELAKITNLTLVTGGFFGATDCIARAFNEVRESNKIVYGSTACVFHVLPMKDQQDFTEKSKQNPDGSFENVSYGKTVFVGESVKERETAVARVFNMCIVVGGGALTAHEVCEFAWNDHYVIPVFSTGGAAAGEYGIPLVKYEAPPEVSERDWDVLSQVHATPEEVAKAIVGIVESLKKAIANQTKLNIAKNKVKGRPLLRSKRGKDDDEQKKTSCSVDNVVMSFSDVQYVDNEKTTVNTESVLWKKKAVHSKWRKPFHLLKLSKAM
ncbi:uncharacterized protein LOC143253817 [Tachypleus tridentatus]|uniref:uncharacterized protein LOC143253817 n=1 Tax=Tachypleus tridentatus TaxID=6853 RepID=UPI003FD12B8F